MCKQNLFQRSADDKLAKTHQVNCVCLCVGSPVSAQPVIMATPHHPTALSSGSGKALALLPGGGGQVQPIHVFQSSSQPSVTMVRVVTSVPPNGYSAVGGVEGKSDLRGTAVWGGWERIYF